MKRDIFFSVFVSIIVFASCTNRAFQQVLGFVRPAISFTDRIDSIVVANMNQYNIPGLSLGVVKNDSMIYTKGYGVVSIMSRKPTTENSIFHTASLSKIFTALAVIHLVEKGQLALEDKLTSVLPQLRFSDKRSEDITIKNLLNHTSGITDLVSYNWSNNNQADNSLRDFLLSKNLKLEFQPSSEYSYSNLAYDVLGLVVEQISGMTFEDYVKINIMIPSGMAASDFRFFQIADTLRTSPHSRRLLSNNVYQRRIYPYTREHASSSTLNSSAKELSRWMISFFERLETETEPYLFRSMTEQSASVNNSIGLGFQLYSVEGKRAIGHFGGDKGFRSFLLMVPDKKIGLVLLANCDYHEEFRQEILFQILREMQKHEDGKITQNRFDDRK